MAGNLPPGVTDKDTDDAGPQRAPVWVTFECEECGYVEDINIGGDVGEQICGCGGLMVRADDDAPSMGDKP